VLGFRSFLDGAPLDFCFLFNFLRHLNVSIP
jgi:hypothetical protein